MAASTQMNSALKLGEESRIATKMDGQIDHPFQWVMVLECRNSNDYGTGGCGVP